VQAKAKARKKRKKAKRPALPKRALLFDLSELPPIALGTFRTGQARAKAAGVSARIIACPFYVYDEQFWRTKLPTERKLPAAEDRRGYAFLDDLLQDLVTHNLMWHILDQTREPQEWFAGWHNSATMGELAWWLADSGFHVVRFTDLYDPDDSNRLRLNFGAPNPKVRV
jgi:hypothetical protein